MAKLTTIRPKVAKLAPMMQAAYDNRDARRADEQPWRRWYFTSRWQKTRHAVRIRDNYTCRLCGLLCVEKGQAVVDHIEPHHGDEALFWDMGNMQTLCAPCHDSTKQAMEKGGRPRSVRRVGLDGYPVRAR